MAIQQKKDTSLNIQPSIVNTNSLEEILRQTSSSFLISTYQAGKLVIVRSDKKNFNTHFLSFRTPMGVAADHEKIALGSGSTIWMMRNVPAAAHKVEMDGHHDACYLPRDIHFTGEIDVHEMAWSGEELWFVNTRFSCLCTMNNRNSFIPRWRPPFISGLDMRDRCHLNGLGIREGRPRYVTALGATNKAFGWRKHKAYGGVLIDVLTNRILAGGLSMPHSPRWHKGRLWFLESGKGTLCYLDPRTRQPVAVATLPGFTRGLDFLGNLAFVGLSKVRETAVFSGIPLTQLKPERICGVYLVDITNGETVAFLQFQSVVEEIFSVNVLPGISFPAILQPEDKLLHSTFVLPDWSLREVVQHKDNLEIAQPWLEKGNTFYNDQKTTEAITCYRKCLEIQPDFLPARFNLGVALGDLGEFDDAARELQKVINAESGYAEAHNSLGFVYYQKKDFQLAEKHYRRALEIKPDYSQAKKNLDIVLSLSKSSSERHERN